MTMRAWLFIVAFWRAIEAYESDMGGFLCRLAWERGYLAAAHGLQGNPYKLQTPPWRAWDHGHHCGKLVERKEVST